MINQIFMGKSAMFAMQRKLQLVANNIANAQTVGFKRSRPEMESMFPLVMEGVLSESDDPIQGTQRRKKYAEYGSGVRITDVTKDFEKGTLEVTNQPLDMAIDSRYGLFQVRMPDGTLAYTRAGNFHMDSQGIVVDPNGHPLEPAIQIPKGTTDIVVNEEGKVFVQINGSTTPQEIGQVILASFQNQGGLSEIGQNLYRETAASGAPNLENPGENGVGSIRQRSLEFSNVNVIEEMMNMILTQRSFELVVKSIQAGEAMLKSASDLGK